MGSDRLFHKRNARTTASLKRKKASRSQYDMILIVCEGRKTEPNYFRSLIDDLQLNTANIIIANNIAGSSPLAIVNFALEEYKKEKEYDRVYCVFDKDRHTTYDNALDKIRRTKLGKGHLIIATTSVPCFEFWLLMHFTYTTKHFDTGKGSICSNVISELKKYLPNYTKGLTGIHDATKDNIATAIKNCKKCLSYSKKANTDMPSTKVHDLVEYLINLKR